MRRRSLDEAREALRSWGRAEQVEVRIELSPARLPDGTDAGAVLVLEQAPLGAAAVERSNTRAPRLEILLELGAVVPNVEGSKLEDAERAVRGAGLRPTVRPAAPRGGGAITKQTPDPGELVALSSAVVLEVSPDERPPPSTRGGTPDSPAPRVGGDLATDGGHPTPPQGRVSPAAVAGVVLGTIALSALVWARRLRALRQRRWIHTHVKFRPEPSLRNAYILHLRGGGALPVISFVPHRDPGTQSLREVKPS